MVSNHHGLSVNAMSNSSMDKEISHLLSEPNFAQFGTVNRDGSPHIDTVWFKYENSLLIVATTLATKKAINISANPNGYVVVLNRNNPYEQAQLKVRLEKISSDETLAVCNSISVQYTGKEFPQRKPKNRVAIYLRVISCKYYIARV
jgi:predicted pyridoxine 5'-phosphate oxidase superfamily flavin-nucleotide-binding protein